MYKNNKNKLKIWSKLFAVLIAMSMILSVVPLGMVMAEVPPTLTVNASVNLENIALGDTTTMTVDITSDAISETRVRHPLDLMLIMDSSGSMRRYSNTINSTYNGIVDYGHWITLSHSPAKYATFTITETTNIGVLLQVVGDNASGSRDDFRVRLLDSNNNPINNWRENHVYVEWSGISAGTYTIEAKLGPNENDQNSNPTRILAIALPPKRIIMAEDKAVDFINDLNDTIDRAGIISFGGTNRGTLNIQYVQDIDDTEVRNAILIANGGTPIGDPIIEALTHINNNPRNDATKAFVLFTDGWHNMGAHSPEYAAQQAKDAGIPIYVIGFGYVDEPRMMNIANVTGGEYFHARTGEDLKDIFDKLATELTSIVVENVTLEIELANNVVFADDLNPNNRTRSWNVGTMSANTTESISFDVKPIIHGMAIPINTVNSIVTFEGGSELVPITNVNVQSGTLTIISYNLIETPPDGTFIGELQWIRGNVTVRNNNTMNRNIIITLNINGIELARNESTIYSNVERLIDIYAAFIPSRSGVHVVTMESKCPTTHRILDTISFTVVIPRVEN